MKGHRSSKTKLLKVNLYENYFKKNNFESKSLIAPALTSPLKVYSAIEYYYTIRNIILVALAIISMHENESVSNLSKTGNIYLIQISNS